MRGCPADGFAPKSGPRGRRGVGRNHEYSGESGGDSRRFKAGVGDCESILL